MLKLNLDRSFLKDVRRGGYGGLIRDSRGNSLYTYAGPVVVSKSNEAEVYAMHVGCHQLNP